MPMSKPAATNLRIDPERLRIAAGSLDRADRRDVVEPVEALARRERQPFGRLHPRDPPAFLVDADEQPFAPVNAAQLVGQRPYLRPVFDVAAEEDVARRIALAKERPLVGGQRQSGKAENGGRHRGKVAARRGIRKRTHPANVEMPVYFTWQAPPADFSLAQSVLALARSPEIAGIDTFAIEVSSTFMKIASDSESVPRASVEPVSGGCSKWLPGAGGGASETRPVICTTSPLREPAGAVLGAVAVFSDLTPVKELEAARRRAERLAYFELLASGIAHEIKNPLVSIKTFAQLLPRRRHDDRFVEDFGRIADREIGRMEQLLERLRRLARPHDTPTYAVRTAAGSK